MAQYKYTKLAIHKRINKAVKLVEVLEKAEADEKLNLGLLTINK